jgi:hypothetical protein
VRVHETPGVSLEGFSNLNLHSLAVKIPGEFPVYGKLSLNLLQADLPVYRVSSFFNPLSTNFIDEFGWGKLKVKNELVAPVGLKKSFTFGRDLNTVEFNI